jgi:hypothetical protein
MSGVAALYIYAVLLSRTAVFIQAGLEPDVPVIVQAANSACQIKQQSNTGVTN